MEQIDDRLLFRWFVGFGVDDPVWDHSTFSKNRDRLLDADVAAKCASSYRTLTGSDTPASANAVLDRKVTQPIAHRGAV